jgi:glycosyltransferase involved in cell wall biosynthesis
VNGNEPTSVAHSNHTRHWQRYAFSHPPAGFRYRRGLDFPFHLFRTRNQFLRHTKWFLPVRSARLYHTYNSIVVNRAPWIVEVEDRIPRYGLIGRDSAQYRYALRRLRSGDCRKIAFSSRYAMECCRDELIDAGVPPERLTVLYRSVPLLDRAPREADGPCRILFVGHGFYRKGGPQLVEALQRLRGIELELRIVSTFEVDWRVYPSEERIRQIREQIEHDPRIICLGRLSHEEVEREMCQADVYACPTLGDSFNSTILEAMGCGLPILATAINAIPEFVEHEGNGLLVGPDDVARPKTASAAPNSGKHEQGGGVAAPPAPRASTMVDALADACRRLACDEDLRRRLGRRSREIIAARFSLELRNEQLATIYRQALA